MRLPSRLALLLAILAVLITAWIAAVVFEELPHLEDEYAYVWQAQAIAAGQLTVPSPPEPKSFLVPFVVDHEGQRFGKYPLGWPILLAFGERFNLRMWINPLLAGLGVWLIYRLGQKIFSDVVGLLAAGLTLSAPFFLMNSGILLSHPWGLVLSTAFALFWLDMIDESSPIPGWLSTLSAGLTLGVLILSRPLTALGVAIPFGIHGIILLVRGDNQIRKKLVATGLTVLMLGSLHFVWQFVLTGDPLRNPYTLWWSYDKLGFGPGYGVTEQGHSLSLAWNHTKFSINAGVSDLFGWGKISWIFLPFGLWAAHKSKRAWVVSAVFPTLIVIYAAYWVGAWLFGPRYYYESLPGIVLLTAAGIAYLAGWPLTPGELYQRRWGRERFRPLVVTGLVTLLIAANMIFYVPQRLGSMRGLFGINTSQLAPFMTDSAQALTPALVIVHTDHWREYAVLLDLSDPFLETPFIFVFSRGAEADANAAGHYPERGVWHYYPDDPNRFYAGIR